MKQRWGILFGLVIFFCGFAAAFLAAAINGVRFGLYLWPLILCVDLFLFSTAGYFSTEGRVEKLYGACSIAGAVCAIVQLGILF